MEILEVNATLSKVMWRLLPVAMLLFFFSLVDRANISYAALEMNKDLGFIPSVYGFAAGIFFIGYFAFEVPSNLIMQRVGARIWLARIMITWGLVVGAMGFVRGETSLYTMRFLLGVAEAGLFPGLLLYLSLWVPKRQRGTSYSLLMSTTAIAYVFGGPLSTALMEFGMAGLKGWQLMFIIEGSLTVLVGFALFAILPNEISEARWLTPKEKDWLRTTLAKEEAEKVQSGATSFRQGFLDGRVLMTTVTCFFLVCANFGTVFWLPQIVKAFGGLSNIEVGLLSSVPYLIGGIAGIFWGRHSDRTKERRWHMTGSAVLATAGYAIAGLTATPTLQFVGICLAALGIWTMFGTFWAYAGDLLGGKAAAGGLAFINSVGSLGGFLGPFLIGFVREHTASFSGSLLVLAGFALLTAIFAACLRHVHQTPEAQTSLRTA